MPNHSKNKPNKDFHNNPPVFKGIDRKRYFYVDEYFKDIVKTQVRGNANIVYIIVAYGYFKATGQFFSTANQVDIDYVTNKLNLNQTYFWKNYKDNTRDRHRKLILSAMGYKPFETESIESLLQIIRTHARSQKNPKVCFFQACRWLFDHKVETPDFDTLTSTINNVYQSHLNEQLIVVKRKLTKKNASLLDTLFEKSSKGNDSMEVYRLTLLKKFKQSTKATNIRENVEAYDLLKSVYDISRPIVEELDFNKEGLKRIANSVNRKQIFQVKRLNDASRHLHLTIFIGYQFNQLVDILLEIIKSAVKSTVNSAETKAKEEYYKQRKEQTAHTQTLVSNSTNLVETMEKLRDTLNNPTLTDAEKVKRSLSIVSPKMLPLESVSESIVDVQNDIDKLSGQALFMKFLEASERSLHLKCNDIICRLKFESDDPASKLIGAIERYQSKGGKVYSNSPTGFLDKSEKEYVDDESGFRKPLYKALLYKHIAENLKWTSLSVADSNRFRHLDDYLFSTTYYEKHQYRLLQLADMEDFKDVDAVFSDLERRIDTQFQETNEHILQNQNEYIEPDGLGGFTLTSEMRIPAKMNTHSGPI